MEYIMEEYVNYNKLVRDKIVDHIIENWWKALYYVVNWSVKFSTATEKLEEERKELLQAIESKDRSGIINEIVDIQEIKELFRFELEMFMTDNIKDRINQITQFVDEIIKEYKLTTEEIETAKKNKLQSKWGFQKWIFLGKATPMN